MQSKCDYEWVRKSIPIRENLGKQEAGSVTQICDTSRHAYVNGSGEAQSWLWRNCWSFAEVTPSKNVALYNSTAMFETCGLPQWRC